MTIDAAALRAAFQRSSLVALQRACGDSGDSNNCRYCGRRWRRWAGSKLDGHAACIVTEEFKEHVATLLRSPTVTYAMLAEAIGVSPAVVRSWTMPTKGGGPS